MISKEEFFELFDAYEKFIEGCRSLEASNLLNMDYIERNVLHHAKIAFDSLLVAYFNLDGADWINYRILEWQEGFKVTDGEKNPIPIKTKDDLWELVKECRK